MNEAVITASVQPDIHLLAKRVTDLSSSVDGWNTVMLWGLALAAFAALLIGWSTRRVVVISGELSEAQGQLSAAKEGILQSDLKAKDLKIAEAAQQISKSNEAASEANERAAALEVKAAQLEVDRARIEQKVVFNGPREVALKADRDSMIANLSEFSGQKVFHFVCGGEYLGPEQAEIGMADNVLVLIFRDAGWVVSGSRHTTPPNEWELPEMDMTCTNGEGIFVVYRPDAPESTKRAADALTAEIFRVLGERTEAGPRGDSAVPPDAETISLFVLAHPLTPDKAK